MIIYLGQSRACRALLSQQRQAGNVNPAGAFKTRQDLSPELRMLGFTPINFSLLFLLLALLLDLVLVAVVKGIVRRPRPTHNKMDMFVTVSVDKYSFPSGHATRAALVCRFVLHHLVLAVPLRVLVVLWALVVGVSRVMLGRHNVTDVLFGLLLGYGLYSVVEYCWLSPLNAPALFALWTH